MLFRSGKPDWMADSLVIDTFYSEAKKSKITVDDDNVILAFQKAAVQYMDKVYGVSGLDSGQLKAMQYAGIKALEHPEITEKTNMKYSRRHNLLVNALSAVGFTVIKPKAGLYLYTKIPKGVEGGETFKNAEHFAQWLIKEKQISVVPWDDVGHYVRISVTFIANTETEELSLVQEIQKRLSGVRFLW